MLNITLPDGSQKQVARGTAVSPQARIYAAEVEGMAAAAWAQAERVGV